MEKAIQPILSSAAQYGLAFLIMVIVIIGLAWAVVSLWKYQTKRDNEMQQLMKENTVAFKDLQGSINILNNNLDFKQ